MTKLWHIYYGTRGTSGAYIDALQLAFKEKELNSWAFVSCNYPFKSWQVIKLFFPMTDFTEKRNFVIKTIRGCELILAYTIIFIAALLFRPKVNLHLIDDFKVTYILYQAFKVIRIPIYVTCHDVIAHDQALNPRRLKILEEAEKLVVHSDFAKQLLLQQIGEKNAEKIIQHPYPYSSYEPILSSTKINYYKELIHDKYKIESSFFLFLGIVRFSKGIEVLLDAWNKSKASTQSQLVIAGKWPANVKPQKSKIREINNCQVIDKYLSSEEFVILIQKAKFVVLPYLDYCHSALLMACARHGGAVIVSDIDLFQEIIPDYPLIFTKGNSQDLAKLLEKTMTLTNEEVDKYRRLLQCSVESLDKELIEGVYKSYQELL
ncbi:glycosyltransferase [Coleofasciculus sp. F4-SAH-05]|uniref:glycosyltransferase n=1 Tax=Coleofasciculus sp. F4-SAH-05 TaxID=3069525 RepID=UPI0032F761F7